VSIFPAIVARYQNPKEGTSAQQMSHNFAQTLGGDTLNGDTLNFCGNCSCNKIFKDDFLIVDS
jgi:hypothetical protein